MKRRDFFRKGVAATAAFTILPHHVLGGIGYVAPSDQITKAIIGLATLGLTIILSARVDWWLFVMWTGTILTGH